MAKKTTIKDSLKNYKPEDKLADVTLQPESEWVHVSDIPKKCGYFPIVIRMIDTAEIKMVKYVDTLPIGSAFVILKTNEDA